MRIPVALLSLLSVTIAGVALLWGADAYSAMGGPVMLLSEEEAAAPDAKPPEGLVDVGGGFETGPAIEMIEPAAGEGVKSPFLIIIRFIPQEGREVDLARLKVEFVKAVTFDVTRRVLPYVTKEGIRIEGAALPKGQHRIRIELGDNGGGTSTRMFLVKVI